MDKKTQMYVGLGVAAVAGYFLYNNWKKKQPVVPPTSVVKFSGNVNTDVVGDRKAGMVGMDATQKQNAVVKDSPFSWGTGTRSFSAGNEMIKDGSWVKAEGDNIAPSFFKVHDSANSFR